MALPVPMKMSVCGIKGAVLERFWADCGWRGRRKSLRIQVSEVNKDKILLKETCFLSVVI